MLFSASMVRRSSRHSPASCLLGVLDGVLNNVPVGLKPIRLLDELAAFDLKHLNPAAAFVLRRSDLQRRYQTAQREAVNHLEALLHVLAGRRFSTCQL